MNSSPQSPSTRKNRKDQMPPPEQQTLRWWGPRQCKATFVLRNLPFQQLRGPRQLPREPTAATLGGAFQSSDQLTNLPFLPRWPGVRMQCCLTPTETIRTIRDGDPRTSTSTFTRSSCCFTSTETIRTNRDEELRTGRVSQGRKLKGSSNEPRCFAGAVDRNAI